MIIDPIDLADRLANLLKAKNQNETYVVRKQHRVAVVEAEILLRQLFSMNNPYKTKKPLENNKVVEVVKVVEYNQDMTIDEYSMNVARAIEKEHGIK